MFLISTCVKGLSGVSGKRKIKVSVVVRGRSVRLAALMFVSQSRRCGPDDNKGQV